MYQLQKLIILFSLIYLNNINCAAKIIDENFSNEEDSSDDENESLFDAIEKHDIEKVKKLVKDGMDLNRSNYEGWTPLTFAISLNDIYLVNSLIDLGADIELMDSAGYLPVDMAKKMGFLEIVHRLENISDEIGHYEKKAKSLIENKDYISIIKLLLFIYPSYHIEELSNIARIASDIIDNKNIVTLVRYFISVSTIKDRPIIPSICEILV